MVSTSNVVVDLNVRVNVQVIVKVVVKVMTDDSAVHDTSGSSRYFAAGFAGLPGGCQSRWISGIASTGGTWPLV